MSDDYVAPVAGVPPIPMVHPVNPPMTRHGDGGGQRGQGHYYAPTETEPAHDAHEIHDNVSTALSAGVIPPSMEAILSSLTAEVEKLRAELAHAHGHERYLADEADHDSLLPLLNRRAFHRELARLFDHMRQIEAPGCVIWVHMGGLIGLRRRIGLAQSDAALQQATQLLRPLIDRADPLGYLDEADFAVAMVLGTPEEAERKAAQIRTALAASPWPYDGEQGLAPHVGTALFTSAATPDLLLADAESDSRL